MGSLMIYFKQSKKQLEPKKLVPKFTFGKQGKELGEFENLFNLAIKDNHLFVADSGNSRIQVLTVNFDGNLSAKFTFGKEGKNPGEFGYITSLVIKDSYLYVVDANNNRIQILEIKY